MRPELKTIEYIESYLTNRLNDTEKQAFEQRMTTDSDFKNDVELQDQLVKSLERISLQQTIQNAQKTYAFWKLLKLIGMILIPLLLAILSLYFLNASAETTREAEIIPTKVEQLKIQENSKIETKEVKEKIVSIPDTVQKKKPTKVTQTQNAVVTSVFIPERYETIPSEIFTIQTEKDTILETQNGIVFLIPKDAFVNSSQQIISGNIQLKIKEALDPMTIMTSGLSTLHNGKPLETGGMFFIEATKNGRKLEINSEKEIVADIPTFNFKENMQLFDGEVEKNGTINWTNPKPLEKALIPQDILSLDFYPPNYLETLSKKGLNSKDKKFTDSLYYSLDYVTKAYNENTTYFSQEYKIDRLRVMKIPRTDGLNPLKVKTIWNERYQNTFIATKAFEERLAVIHKNCVTANTLLDIYVNNLDSDLHVLDSIAAISAYTGTEEMDMDFYRFTKQHLTNVANPTADVSKLNDYYLNQQKVYRLALEKSQEKMDSLMNVDRKYQQFSKQQLQDYYSKELAITTKKVAKNLNVALPRSFNQVQNNQTNVQTSELLSETSIARTMTREKRKRRYRAPIRTTGWKNIDRIIDEGVISSLKSRTTTTIKGRKVSATISYSDYEISIENTERFDKLFVYLVPTEFNSFVKLEAKNDRFIYKLNDLLKYRVYCIAYLDEVPFYIEKSIRTASDKVQLEQITNVVLREKLAKITTKNNSLETEILYQTTRKTNDKTLKKYRKIVKLKKEIEAVVFPCKKYQTLNTYVNDTVRIESSQIIFPDTLEEPAIPFGTVEESPLFPNYDRNTTKAEKKTDFENAVKGFIKENFNMNIIDTSKYPENEFRISFSMRIETSGIMNLTFGSKNDAIRKELNRIADLFPKVTPGKQNGIPVDVNYVFSIVFSL